MEHLKFDDFDIVIRDRYYVKLDLILPEEGVKEAIIFKIIYINDIGEEQVVNEHPEVRICPTPSTIFLSTYIKILESIFKLDDETRSTIESTWTNDPSTDPISFPNEYTMFHLNHYLHNYLFLHPFETYLGARLRLANLMRVLVSNNIIKMDMLPDISSNIKNHHIELNLELKY